jgi:CcmD family protein
MTRMAALLLTLVLAGGSVFAQQPPKPPSASQDEFVPVTGPIDQSDTMPAPLLVGTAYAFIWIVLFGYLWSIRRRLASVEKEMSAIDRRLASGRK